MYSSKLQKELTDLNKNEIGKKSTKIDSKNRNSDLNINIKIKKSKNIHNSKIISPTHKNAIQNILSSLQNNLLLQRVVYKKKLKKKMYYSQI